jgi:hypothetical protein
MDDADIGGILLPGRPGQVRPRIGAPVAKKGYNPRFKLSHLIPPYKIYAQGSFHLRSASLKD